MAVTRGGQHAHRLMHRQPDGGMPTALGRRAPAQHGMRQVDRAYLFCPQVILWHVRKASVGAQAAINADRPAGFLEHLAVQRGDGLFTLVDAAAGKLVFGNRLCLMEWPANGPRPAGWHRHRVGGGIFAPGEPAHHNDGS